jgi:nucleoside-diphosphate-sugar epimerase
MSKTILVTGGAGYVGSVLVRGMLNRNYKVRVLDKLIFTKKPLKDIKDKIELIKGDIREVGPEIMNDVEAVIHLAGFATEPTSQYNPRYTDLVNHIATERIAKMAKEKGIERFIFASSCSVYFTYDTPLNPLPLKETDSVNPISPYSISKIAAEQALLELSDKKFRPIIFRKGTIYGLSPRMRYDLVLNSFIKDAFSRRRLTVNCGGQIWRPLIDIQDVVRTYIQALEMSLDKIGGRIFNINNDNWNILDLAKKVQKILKEKKGINVEIDIQPVGITRNYKADNSLFKQVFQFTPARNLEDAIFEIWHHLENHSNDISNPIYYNDKWEIPLIESGLI